MTDALILLMMVIGTIGLCLTICVIGWWGTLTNRLEWRHKDFLAKEEAKKNAIIIDTQNLNLQEKQLEIAERSLNLKQRQLEMQHQEVFDQKATVGENNASI